MTKGCYNLASRKGEMSELKTQGLKAFGIGRALESDELPEMMRTRVKSVDRVTASCHYLVTSKDKM